MTPPPPPAGPAVAARRARAGFMWRHPARLIALGFGAGLSPWAPGTVGTLWAWVAFLVLDHWLDAGDWAVVIALGLVVGWWACTRTARELGTSDPRAIVWDEIVAFWIVLWIVLPMGLAGQLAAFALFRYLDAVKPGPVAWADRLFKGRPGVPPGWTQGFGILFDDLVAAGGALLVIALSVASWRAFG